MLMRLSQVTHGADRRVQATAYTGPRLADTAACCEPRWKYSSTCQRANCLLRCHTRGPGSWIQCPGKAPIRSGSTEKNHDAAWIDPGLTLERHLRRNYVASSPRHCRTHIADAPVPAISFEIRTPASSPAPVASAAASA